MRPLFLPGIVNLEQITHFSCEFPFLSSLLKAHLNRVPIDSTALLVEAQKIAKIAERIAIALVEYFTSSQFPKKCYPAVISSSNLGKTLKTQIWNHNNILNGIDITTVDANRLAECGINTIDNLLQTNPREIEEVRLFPVFFQFRILELKS